MEACRRCTHGRVEFDRAAWWQRANILHADQHQDNHLRLFFMLVLVKRDGWRMISQEAGHPSDDVAPGTLNGVQNQAGLKK